MKLLDGRELADYIKERQAGQVRGLRSGAKVTPKLAIIQAGENQVSDAYIRMKQNYGQDILVDVDVIKVAQGELVTTIERLNKDASVHGIIVQLPLPDPVMTDEVVNVIDPAKDVDGLGEKAKYTSATALAIDWLLAGYNVELRDKAIAIVGNGRLVGAPLAKLWATTGYNVTVYDDETEDLHKAIRHAQVVVTATGVPGLITPGMLQMNAVVVDAGTASENGRIVGDVAENVRERDDLTITPEKGGVGPLTVTALFDNVIQAAKSSIPA